jgi:adenosylcobinamide kinase/adenosylcobinamide-phosphate guanylyltransferase
MTARISRHQSRRGNKWATLEEPVDISAAIARTRDPLLVDCLTIWLSNLMHLEKDLDEEAADLCQVLQEHDQLVVLVSNEVGGGIVPENKLARRFRDAAGLLNQRVASVADSVYLVTAGLPQKLK